MLRFHLSCCPSSSLLAEEGDHAMRGGAGFETTLFKLEVLDHKTRERAVIAPTIGASIPVLLELDAAAEALQVHSARDAVFQSVYNYWKAKREQWQKPILRRLQPPPPVNDTNLYNVFRPREKDPRLHTRRMQRRENDVQSFEKLRQVRRNLCQSKTVLKTLIKREVKKQEVIESIFSVQRIEVKEKNEAQLVEDGVAFPGFPSNSYRYGSSDDDYVDSDNTSNYHPHAQSQIMQHSAYLDSWLIVIPTGRMKGELKQRPRLHGWFHEPHEPVMLFTNLLEPERLADAGIIWPQDHPIEDGSVAPPHRFNGRMGRGGRIIFDRWNPLLQFPVDHESSSPVPRHDMPPPPSG